MINIKIFNKTKKLNIFE